MSIILRFVQGKDFASKAIMMLEKTAMPFTPSHVECVMPDGKWCGALFAGGTRERDPGYDKATMARELFLSLPSSAEQDQLFYADMRKHIGEPYDWPAILGFVLPDHEHAPEHAICSARITLSLRVAKWFSYPLAAPAHLIDPRDLLLMLSAQMQIPGI